MATPNLAEIPSDLLADFRLESSEQFQRCEQLLIELEHAPDDRERLRELFRLVHTLKGNLGYIGLDSLMSVPQAMEDVLSCLREGQLHFDSLLGDILLLTLDHLKEQIRHALGGQAPQLSPAQSKALSRSLSALAIAPTSQQIGIRSALLQELDPSSKPPEVVAADNPAAADLLRRYGIEPDADLLFFVDLMQASERRSHFWQGRGLRQLDLAAVRATHDAAADEDEDAADQHQHDDDLQQAETLLRARRAECGLRARMGHGAVSPEFS